MKNKQHKVKAPNQNPQGAFFARDTLTSPSHANTPVKDSKKILCKNDLKKAEQRKKSTDLTTPHKGHVRVCSVN